MKQLVCALISLLIVFTTFNIQPATALDEDLTGTVSWIVDGDTFDINNGAIRIRPADIDAPESYETGYNASKWYLYDLIYGKTVYLDRSNLNGVDNGRQICMVYLSYNNTHYLNVNLQIVQSGHAIVKDYNNDFNPNTWTIYTPKSNSPPSPQPSYTLTILSQTGSGSTDPTTANYTYNNIVTVPVQATPSSGWVFDHWILDGSNIGNQNPYTVYMNTNHQLRAVFTQSQTLSPTPPPTYQLIVLSPEGSGTTNPVPASYNYHLVVPVKVIANPSNGWQFDHWLLDGTDIVKTNPYTVNMNANHTIKAVFTNTPTYILIVEAPTGSGSTDPGASSHTYKQPASVSVKATSAFGWAFDHWLVDGVNVGNVNPYVLSMNADHRIQAIFVVKNETVSSGGIPSYPFEVIVIGLLIFLGYRYVELKNYRQ